MSDTTDRTLAITVSVRGDATFTMEIPGHQMDHIAGFVERNGGIAPERRLDPVAHAMVLASVREMLSSRPVDLPHRPERVEQVAAASVLWCALNGPGHGHNIRSAILDSLEFLRVAHLLAFANADGVWGFLVSKRSAAPRDLAAVIPEGFGSEELDAHRAGDQRTAH